MIWLHIYPAVVWSARLRSVQPDGCFLDSWSNTYVNSDRVSTGEHVALIVKCLSPEHQILLAQTLEQVIEHARQNSFQHACVLILDIGVRVCGTNLSSCSFEAGMH